jgi:hypothetical protein
MMTRRNRISIVVLILIALLLLLAWLMYVLFSSNEIKVDDVVEQQVIEDIIPSRPTVSEQELEDERTSRVVSADVVSLSKTFVERYGSYSDEANFANLTDVLVLMSDDFARETQNFINKTAPLSEFYSINTAVITVNVDSQDDATGVAQVTIMTQREEALESPQDIDVRFQEIVLTFVMEDGSWKVDSANWQ